MNSRTLPAASPVGGESGSLTGPEPFDTECLSVTKTLTWWKTLRQRKLTPEGQLRDDQLKDASSACILEAVVAVARGVAAALDRSRSFEV